MVGFLLFSSLSFLVILSLTFPVPAKPPIFSKYVNLNPSKFGTEKHSHIQLYWHDIQSGTNPTSISIIKPLPNNSSTPTLFGDINMIDNPMTEKPEVGSKLLGRAQGFYALSSQEEVGILVAMNFVFTTERYNGSTLTVLGRNPVNQKVREMPVIGGSGLFRFARGYVHASTYSLNTKTGDAIIKYDVYVLHY